MSTPNLSIELSLYMKAPSKCQGHGDTALNLSKEASEAPEGSLHGLRQLSKRKMPHFYKVIQNTELLPLTPQPDWA